MQISFLEFVAIILLSIAASIMTLFVWAFRTGSGSPANDGMRAIMAKLAGFTAGYLLAFFSFTLDNVHVRWWLWAAAVAAFVGGAGLSVYLKKLPDASGRTAEQTATLKRNAADLD